MSSAIIEVHITPEKKSDNFNQSTRSWL